MNFKSLKTSTFKTRRTELHHLKLKIKIKIKNYFITKIQYPKLGKKNN